MQALQAGLSARQEIICINRRIRHKHTRISSRCILKSSDIIRMHNLFLRHQVFRLPEIFHFHNSLRGLSLNSGFVNRLVREK